MQQLRADQPWADDNGFPGWCQLTSGAGLSAMECGQGSQGAPYHQEPGLLLVEALGLQSALTVKER